MPVAAIYDIHGNLPALETVLQDIRRADVDQVVVGGDMVPGPMPRETIECLLDLDIPVQFIQGNGEADVLAEMAGMEVSRVPEQFREVVRWSALQLRPEHEQLLANWPSTCRLEMAFEEEFSVEVPDEDAEKLQTVGDVIKYIEERSKQQGG